MPDRVAARPARERSCFVLLVAVTGMAACGVADGERPWADRSERAAREFGVASSAAALPASSLGGTLPTPTALWRPSR
jgi:hypothetical protein